MENKINIAELLKDCPKGMELDCTMFENVTFVKVDMNMKFPIEIAVSGIRSKYLTKEGCFHDIALSPESKCVIFPKGKTTWDGFQRPFKDGDIVATRNGIYIGIIKIENNMQRYAYVAINEINNLSKNIPYSFERFATEEERQKLFDAIKANGYKWNFETKTLEKLPKFKIGDKIKKKGNNDYRLTTIESINNNYYVIKTPDWFDNCYITDKLYFSNQDNYELVPSKFDITTLKPFDSRVLVRDANCYEWEADIFGRYSDGYITLGGGKWKQCIPYEGNEHLLGTNNDCDEYYKTW